MAMMIHPTAIVEDGAQLGADVSIGAYAFIGANVKLGDRTVIQHHACVEGHTTLGCDCEVFSFACIGKKTQDLKYAGGTTYVEVGDRSVMREFSTINLGTKDGEVTRMGSDCLLMTYSHIAHGCRVGNHVIMSNSVQLAGEVTVNDYAVVGGMVGVHQFVRIGQHSMVGGLSSVKQDVAPFMVVDGVHPPETRGVNLVGLKRRGFSLETCSLLKEAYRLIYRENLNRSQAIERIGYELPDTPEIRQLIEFYKTTQRGVI